VNLGGYPNGNYAFYENPENYKEKYIQFFRLEIIKYLSTEGHVC
jgi:hypothetical protein